MSKSDDMISYLTWKFESYGTVLRLSCDAKFLHAQVQKCTAGSAYILMDSSIANDEVCRGHFKAASMRRLTSSILQSCRDLQVATVIP